MNNRKLDKVDVKNEKKENIEKSSEVLKEEKKNKVQEITYKFESMKSSECCQTQKSHGMKMREEGSECMHHNSISHNPNRIVRLRDSTAVQQDYGASPGKRKLEIDDYTIFLGTNGTPKKWRGSKN